jgi:type II secretory pathway pseudopilin PulG
MSFVSPRRSGTAGFSLLEALVALAIAAFLVAVLTRFVSGTRANALQIRETLALDMLGESLLERLGATQLRPGRTNGRSGALFWHIDVSPIVFYAHATSMGEKKRGPVATAPGQAPVVGLTAPTTPAPQTPQTPDKQPARVVWNPYHVKATISRPSGQTYEIDTIRIVLQKPEKAPTQADQR